MANNRVNVSPSINFSEQDLSFAVRNFGITQLGIAGETLKGPAFEPIEINDYQTFKACFGGLNPCKFVGTQQPQYEAAYIAKTFLQESDQLQMTRVLGLSGYDAGDAWGITFGAAVDPTTIEDLTTDTFSLSILYINGGVNTVVFSNSELQDLYDAGKISNSIFGGSALVTGESITLTNTLLGDCDGNFSGARFTATLTGSNEDFICLTGTTITGSNVATSGVTQTCTVVYSAGTVTNNSTLVITVINPITIINQSTNEVTIVSNGNLQLDGGSIEHFADGSLIITSGTITFPNGDIITGGEYKICDLEGNSAVYDCNTVQGTGYSITTGETTTTLNVYTTGSTIVETQIPSGIITHTFSGTVVELSGSAYTDVDNTLVTLFRSKASYDGNETLNFQVEGDVLTITPISGTRIDPFDDFILSGTKANGQTFSYTVSLDPSKKNYIGKVFNSFQKCCEVDAPLFIEENYITNLQNLIEQGKVDCIKSDVCFISNINDYKTEYRGAETPWLVSELRGDRVFKLFKVHTFSDGNAANKDIKISIQNIRPDKQQFDLVVRAYGDTDRRPVVLESYTRLSLDSSSNNYIARKIGTVDGDYARVGKYILIEMANECLADSFPAGYEGYPIRDYVCATAPQMQFKTEYGLTDRVRQTYLGLSDTNNGYDQDMFDFKGLPADANLQEWTGRTSGFHLDKDAGSATVEGSDLTTSFEVGNANFQNEADLNGTDYEKINSRKFTLAVYGGFDGWDIYRTERTNDDSFVVTGSKGQLGLVAQNFDTYVTDEGDTVINSDYYAYLKAIRKFANSQSVLINLLATPAINTTQHSNLIEDTIDMVENERCDTLYVVTTLDTDEDGEMLRPDDIVSQIDGLYDSNYTATYSYWTQYNDTENNTLLYIPPTAEVMRIFALTDKVAAPWYAGAGARRGELVNTVKLRKDTTQDDRDDLYDGRINGLAKFIINRTARRLVFGNKTLQEEDTALNRINVRRLLLHLRRLVADVSIGLLFEQNDSVVRQQFEQLVNPILRNVREQRGIFDFRINLDSSAESFDRGELNGTIFIQPIKSLEFINIGFTITNTGASFDDV